MGTDRYLDSLAFLTASILLVEGVYASQLYWDKRQARSATLGFPDNASVRNASAPIAA